MGKKKKIRAEFRKNRSTRARPTGWTRQFDEHGFQDEDPSSSERVSGKGELTRRRTIHTAAPDTGDDSVSDVRLDVDEAACRRGRVLSVHGQASIVQAEGGEIYECTVRRVLKTLATDQRNVIAAGDRVLSRPLDNPQASEGFIVRVEPRRGIISRAVRGRQHVLVTNIDQMLIVASVAEPRLKPNLIDRMLVTAEKGGVRPVICINKIDLVDSALLQPLVGVYSRMGYQVLLLSAKTGVGIERFRHAVNRHESVVAGQSGVGKSSLLNAIDPELHLRVAEVSSETEKGRHTTTTARLLPIASGGYVVDTPGIRQFQLWDVIPEEISGFFRDLRPYVSLCHFPDCTHTHEADCAVKDAVAKRRLDQRRYQSYCHMLAGQEEMWDEE
jgi:ribosome biogenesis GTPase / thiamine phosphate phosphatase